MILGKKANARAHVHFQRRGALPALQQRNKAPFLDKIKQFFFRREVIIEARQAHFCGPGYISYRRSMKSLFRKDFGRDF